MKTLALFVCLSVFLSVAAFGQQAKEQSAKVGEYTITGPFAHDNLAVFLIHGPDKLGGKKLLTLQEAIEQKKVIIHETSNVSELSVENLSDEEVFIQSGDIVKGGQQDRTLVYDFIVPPNSGKIPIASFCVESGRWSSRGQEEARKFAESNQVIAGKQLKMAAKSAGDQGEVWSNVDKMQKDLQSNSAKVITKNLRQAGVAEPKAAEQAQRMAREVTENASPSSMQLALESKAVTHSTENYLKALQPIIEGKKDVVGFAFAINGKLNSVDIYASPDLFRRLWPKMLQAAAVESVAEYKDDKKFDPTTVSAVKDCIEDAEKGKATEKVVGKHMKLIQRDSEKSMLFDSSSSAAGESSKQILHRNILTK